MSLKCDQNRTQMAFDCGIGPGTHFLRKINHIGWKNDSKRDPILEPKLALVVSGFSYFHPWADKIAQEALEGAQGDPKGTKNHNMGREFAPQIAKNVPKFVPKSQNGAVT